MDTAKIPFGHPQTFPIAKNRKFRVSVVTARAESIFTVYGKVFSSCVCYSATDLYSSMRQSHDTGCASSSDAQFHRTLLYTFFTKFVSAFH